MYEDQKAFQVDKNQQTLKVSLKENRLQIKCLHKHTIKKGTYTFDALPQLLKIFINIEEMYHHLEEIKNTEDLQVVPQGLQISYAISPKIKRKVILALEKGVLTQQEKLEIQVHQLKSQLEKFSEDKKNMEIKIQKMSNFEIEYQKLKEKLDEANKANNKLKNYIKSLKLIKLIEKIKQKVTKFFKRI